MRHRSLLTALIATLAIFLTGCSRNPVAPTTGITAAPVAGPMGIGLEPDDPAPADGGTPLARTIALNPTDEGVLTVGRFSLWVRKNSLKQPIQITLHVTDPEALEVHMEVSPPQANDFQVPLVLTANMSDVADFDYVNGTMLYWDGNWVQIADVASQPNQQDVVARMNRLADCKVTVLSGKSKNKLGA